MGSGMAMAVRGLASPTPCAAGPSGSGPWHDAAAAPAGRHSLPVPQLHHNVGTARRDGATPRHDVLHALVSRPGGPRHSSGMAVKGGKKGRPRAWPSKSQQPASSGVARCQHHPPPPHRSYVHKVWWLQEVHAQAAGPRVSPHGLRVAMHACRHPAWACTRHPERDWFPGLDERRSRALLPPASGTKPACSWRPTPPVIGTYTPSRAWQKTLPCLQLVTSTSPALTPTPQGLYLALSSTMDNGKTAKPPGVHEQTRELKEANSAKRRGNLEFEQRLQCVEGRRLGAVGSGDPQPAQPRAEGCCSLPGGILGSGAAGRRWTTPRRRHAGRR